MEITLSLAKKLLNFNSVVSQNAGELKSVIITEMIANGVLQQKVLSAKRSIIECVSFERLQDYLQNNHGINNLELYISVLENSTNKADLALIANDTKLKPVRSITGFLVNTIKEEDAFLMGKKIIIKPQKGSALFISDYESFFIPEKVIIVGIENPYNFLHITQQQKYFANGDFLFVSRYPQNKDILKWLQRIPNNYVHFGDFDYAGINIYYNEFKKHLGRRASFFVPYNIEALIKKHGNRALFNKQQLQENITNIDDENLIELIALIGKYGKGLEQEVLAGGL